MKYPWIVSRRDDLACFIGPVVASFLVVGAYMALRRLGAPEGIVLAVLYFSWAVLFDGTHVFATYSRTYFDPGFRRRSMSLLIGSLGLLFVGPAIIAAGLAAGGPDSARALFLAFNRFALTFAYYHLVRQHWGIIALYRAKGGETDERERRLEGLLLAFGVAVPYVANSWLHLQPIHFTETLSIDGATWDRVTVLVAGMGLATLGLYLGGRARPWFPASAFRTSFLLALAAALAIAVTRHLGLSLVLATLTWAGIAGFAVVLARYAALVVDGARHGRALNAPKLLLMAAVLVAHNLILLLPLPSLIPVISLTLFHNVQYHRIVRFHNVNAYAGDHAAHGMAGLMTRRLAVFVGLALLFNFTSTLPRAAVNGLVRVEMVNYLLGAFFWGIAFHHYYIDARIWRVRRSAPLSRALSLSGPPRRACRQPGAIVRSS